MGHIAAACGGCKVISRTIKVNFFLSLNNNAHIHICDVFNHLWMVRRRPVLVVGTALLLMQDLFSEAYSLKRVPPAWHQPLNGTNLGSTWSAGPAEDPLNTLTAACCVRGCTRAEIAPTNPIQSSANGCLIDDLCEREERGGTLEGWPEQ